MIIHEYNRRVQYADVDRMDFVYYGRYAEYLEAARVELIRELGLSYREIEDQGVLMPVLEYHIRYRKPAKYDDLLKIHSEIRELPETRMTVESVIFDSSGNVVAEAKVVLVFLDVAKNRPRAVPDFFLNLMKRKWQVGG